MTSTAIVNKVWNFCHILRDDGVGYGDYLEQLTFLLFLKMADEYSRPPHNRDTHIPDGYNWESLRHKSGAELEGHYVKLLAELGKHTGMLGDIFVKAQNKISDPAKLHKLIQMIDGESWVLLGADVKGDIYEGLLQKNAEDTKSGAGQYFTPRALIQAMVECVRPEPMKTIADPACGTGGFFLAALDHLNARKLNKEQLRFLKYDTFRGWEIVTSTARLCLMNLFLHNIGDMDHDSPITRDDSLRAAPTETFDYVLTNPPFGKKSSITVTTDEGEEKRETLTYNRQDFWATTSNKQLNFVQHIRSMLKADGKAAVVLPDNVLFEGGAGETVRRELMRSTELHTILRLPTGIFYAQGVKANVLFFDNRPASKTPWTKEVWIYDYRTNVKHTLKADPMKYEDLQDFITCYNPADRHKRKETWPVSSAALGLTGQGRWRKFTYDEILARDKASLDIFWLKDDSLEDSANLPEPGVLAAEIVEDLEAALEQFRLIADDLGE
ncbi:MAG TPA: class I SAM-dependent DNA methyltransferase [Flavobacteriales bacterium]|nr:class I SAM-dependent DNA methyltransferase [Flavobacteriales bacterium]